MKKILVYRCGTIGDTIVAVPAIQALRNAYPGASLVLMTASSAKGGIWADTVLREFGWFDDFVTYDPVELGSARKLARLAARVRRLGADTVIHLGSERNSWVRIQRDRLFFALAGITNFFGHASECVTWDCRLRTRDRIYPHEVDRLRGIASQAGATDEQATFDMPLRVAHQQRIDALLRDAQVGNDELLIGMCPGSKQSAKRWPGDRYGEIGRRLIAAYNAHLFIVGGDDERLTGERIAASTWQEGRWTNAASRLSVLESAELLRRCRMYVGNDTGAMHLAAAVGTPCVAIYAARCPEQSWNPYGGDHIVLRRRVACRNCFLTDCTENGLRCLTEIDVDEVWSACQRVLVYR